jgi:hypothetical protein
MVRLSECGVVDLADEGMKGVGDATKTSSVRARTKKNETDGGGSELHPQTQSKRSELRTTTMSEDRKKSFSKRQVELT